MSQSQQELKKRKPELEKLIIGPLMVSCEMLSGGHYMEMLKIIRQAQGISYFTAMKDLWVNEGFLGFYKGFAPWGAIQIVKGVPVLFIQSECEYRFKKLGMDQKTADTLAGIMGGVGQGIFMTPTQRLKTIVMTDPKYGGAAAPKSIGEALKSTTVVAVEVVKTDGIGTIFKGLVPMMAKRGLDWGLRFYGVSVAKEYFTGGDNKPLTLSEKLASGFFGGMVSTLTMPLDSLVANAQKASKAGVKKNVIAVAQEMWATGGSQAFVRGWVMRVVHAGYHTMWMTTIGQFAFDWWRARK